ncbi:hypothetical protein DLJ60_01825 [Micromonospora chalcea]|uniref:SMI1/KNR4 family protein n=1 Tax=Micromonospora chalcea TaxID=1874 RepID=A0ABX9YCK1_MICCH|nr:hypothetical protein DLJ60_01825 [Micromonospora chalcea]
MGVSGTAVDRLAALVGWNGRSSHRPDWSSLHAAFGHRFPTDFQQYVERFPPGTVDFVQVFHPYERDFQGDPAVYVEQLLARTDPANDIEDWYRFGNAPGELFSWGTVNGEFELCWELTNGPPDTWTCVVADIRCQTGERHPGGMVDLLLDVLGGTGRVSSLDYLREILPTAFEPYL